MPRRCGTAVLVVIRLAFAPVQPLMHGRNLAQTTPPGQTILISLLVALEFESPPRPLIVPAAPGLGWHNHSNRNCCAAGSLSPLTPKPSSRNGRGTNRSRASRWHPIR